MKTIFQLIEEHGLKGLKVRHSSWWDDREYVVCIKGGWVDESNLEYIMNNADECRWEIYTENKKPKMVTWYRPKLVRSSNNRITIHSVFYKSKERFHETYDEFEVVNDEWETIEAPEKMEGK